MRGGQRCYDTTMAFMVSRGLQHTSECSEALLCASTLDALLLFDRCSVCNSAAAEILSRRLSGLLLDLKNIRSKADLKTSRRGDTLRLLDLVGFEDEEFSGPSAAKEIQQARDAEVRRKEIRWCLSGGNILGVVG